MVKRFEFLSQFNETWTILNQKLHCAFSIIISSVDSVLLAIIIIISITHNVDLYLHIFHVSAVCI